MAENTLIEWADHTFNPWEGCQHAGPGCDLCYAETRNARFGGGTAPNWGPGAPRRRTSATNWRKPLAWNRAAELAGRDWDQPAPFARPRVFCASLADVFDNAAPDAWRNDLWDLIEETPALTWLLLTKRIGNVEGMIRRPWLWNPPHNIIMGATMVNQHEVDRDHGKLLEQPIPRLFVSMEPLLGPIRIPPILLSAKPQIIVGGENGGPRARTMELAWARDIRDQCAPAGVPFFFKQTTNKGPIPADLQIREMP